MRAIIKSIIFNIAFFSYCIGASLFFFWAFALPRKHAFQAILYYFRGAIWVERLFLGLDYRVSGRENLPPKGTPYILAVKHYSAYETLAVPVIFGDIAIILKKELTWIPFWGWYTIKTGMIPIDRGAGAKAIASLIRGAKRVIAQGRPILIFPQGTRVNVNDTTADKPYKVGIAKIATNLNLPIVPVAINSGVFWPKHGFIKKAGIVDFKILPMIPAGLPVTDTLKQLEAAIEPASAKLCQNAKIDHKYAKSFWPRGSRTIFKWALRIFILWAGWWHMLAFTLNNQIETALSAQTPEKPLPITSPYKPKIDGFPGALHLSWQGVEMDTKDGPIIRSPMVEAHIMPLPGAHADIGMPQGFTVEGRNADDATSFKADRARIDFKLPALWKPRDTWAISIIGIDIASGAASLGGKGDISVPITGGTVAGEIAMTAVGYRELIDILVANKLMDGEKSRVANSFFDAMASAQGQGGQISFPLKVINGVVYAGFVRLFAVTNTAETSTPNAPLPGALVPSNGVPSKGVPSASGPIGQSGLPLQKNHSGGWGIDSPPAPIVQMPAQPPQP